MLAYNYSPSFNWRKALAPAKIASFQRGIAQMGYRFQFVTLAGFHSLNLTKFNLARDYRRRGMGSSDASRFAVRRRPRRWRAIFAASPAMQYGTVRFLVRSGRPLLSSTTAVY